MRAGKNLRAVERRLRALHKKYARTGPQNAKKPPTQVRGLHFIYASGKNELLILPLYLNRADLASS